MDDPAGYSGGAFEGVSRPQAVKLLAGAAPEVLQFRLPPLGFVALRLTDYESAAADVFRFI
jgi:hypothetical protein